MEEFKIQVDKGQEIEIHILEKDKPGILAFIWFRLIDFQKHIQVTNEKAPKSPSLPTKMDSDMIVDSPSNPVPTEETNHIFDSWVDLEPGGQLAMVLEFSEEKLKKVLICIKYKLVLVLILTI
jgi:hypothetical protein